MNNSLRVLKKELNKDFYVVSTFLQGSHVMLNLLIMLPHQNFSFGKSRSFLITPRRYLLSAPYVLYKRCRLIIITSNNLAAGIKSCFIDKAKCVVET